MRAIVERFVSGIDGTGIPWCHWKSNEHIEAGLDGYTDLDLLFPSDRRGEIEAQLENAGYVRFRTPPHRTYPYIVDYLGIAEETGRLIHLQCHYALILGEEQLKSYVVPWASEILDRRVPWDGDDRIATAHPTDELVLLILRAALKIRWRDRLRRHRGRPIAGWDFEREFSWLKARVDVGELETRTMSLLGEEHARRFVQVYSEGATSGNMTPASYRLRRFARRQGWRRMGSPAARAFRWRNESIEAVARLQRRLGIRRPLILRRRTPQVGGALIPVLGVDGSGKSSVTHAVLKDWRPKIDIERVYFGTGDGPRSLLFRAASFAGRIAGGSGSGQALTELDPGHGGWREIVRAVLTARQKRKDMKWALELRDRGVIVVCDRYPQDQIPGYNDGPRLTSLMKSASFLRRLAARYEAGVFRELTRAVPDTAIRLKPSLEVAYTRKNGETPRAVLERKLDAMMRIRFPESTPVRVVDADMPFDAVLVEVKRHIWRTLAA